MMMMMMIASISVLEFIHLFASLGNMERLLVLYGVLLSTCGRLFNLFLFDSQILFMVCVRTFCIVGFLEKVNFKRVGFLLCVRFSSYQSYIDIYLMFIASSVSQ